VGDPTEQTVSKTDPIHAGGVRAEPVLRAENGPVAMENLP
jgi:hypothetical protein